LSEKISAQVEWAEVSTGACKKLSDEPVTGAGMDAFGDDDIAQLLRLKRYEQPPASYYENFLSEFRRRQRDELLRQPVWRICFAQVAVESSPVPSTPPANASTRQKTTKLYIIGISSTQLP
jgi:hypothetical protein